LGLGRQRTNRFSNAKVHRLGGLNAGAPQMATAQAMLQGEISPNAGLGRLGRLENTERRRRNP
jgi:hypothetical protein